ncbi:vacuolar protein-sorting-associated protein 25 isoform X1 [Loxodonta africana]|uniref:vacuolar protein-sorting-associated protein 25 isoform X1 n=2 Tax=Afrotheria TaxID=311790 RepID=UPI0030CFCEAD
MVSLRTESAAGCPRLPATRARRPAALRLLLLLGAVLKPQESLAQPVTTPGSLGSEGKMVQKYETYVQNCWLEYKKLMDPLEKDWCDWAMIRSRVWLKRSLTPALGQRAPERRSEPLCCAFRPDVPKRRPEVLPGRFRVPLATTMAMSFEWPWQYRFPPFFTLQPNVDTRQKQLAAWCSLVLSFCRLHKQSSMTVMEAQESPLFNNVKLQRKLPVESIQIVLEELRKKGNLEWLDKNKSSFLIMWRRPEEWGKLIYQWVSKSGQNNSVFTLYELTNGEDTEDEEFHGLDEATLLRALQALQQEHKAEIITVSDGRGVKFF